MIAKCAAGAAFILLLAGCGRGAQDDTADVAQQSADTPVEAFFRFGPIPLGENRAAFRKALGEPDSTTAAAVPNRHDAAVTDSIFTLHYPGLAAELYRASYDGKELLASVTITDDRYLRPDSPLRMGMSEDEVRLLLGEPGTVAADLLSYPCTSCNAAGYDVLELQLAKDVLRRIVLRYWID